MKKNKLAYEQLCDYLYEYTYNQIDMNDASFLWAVFIKSSHDGKEWDESHEVFEIDLCDQTLCWFNDWYEGQPYIRLIGIIDIEEIFSQGEYVELKMEYEDEQPGSDK